METVTITFLFRKGGMWKSEVSGEEYKRILACYESHISNNSMHYIAKYAEWGTGHTCVVDLREVVAVG